MPIISIKNLQKSFINNNRSVEVLGDVNLEIERGELLAIFGPNGCGKTTLLNIIANLIKPDNGQIIFQGQSIEKAKVSYIFQNYRETLFPWLKVIDNITLPLKLEGVEKQVRDNLAKELVEKFHLQIDLNEYPYNLSGGQQQLIALLRGLIVKPDLLLLDEPFSALDYQTTLFLYKKLLEIWENIKTTVIFVSHNIDEAIFLSNRLIMFSTKPTKVIIDRSVDLPYPRELSLFTADKFTNLKGELLKDFSQQVFSDNSKE